MAHFLVVTYPAQGHINPALHFARRLARTGARVTFTSTVFAHRRMIKPTTPDALSYAPFSDGYDDGFVFSKEGEQYMASFRQVGQSALSDLIRNLAREGRPVTCVVYTILLSWAADVARDEGIPSSLLWIQPATVFVIYYHYFHGYDSFVNKDTSSTIELPGLPPLSYQELPSFLLSADNYPFILETIRELFKMIDREEKPHVLVNTFDELEGAALRAVDAVQMGGVGPLIPSALLDSKEKAAYYVEWLDSKPRSSVVYVSFGTLSNLSKRQMDEISNGLSESSRPFLWVVREPEDGADTYSDTEIRSRVGSAGVGLVVPWCCQVEVLSHPSVGCFVTHCGWNSTTEGLGKGSRMVCFPQWSDQLINAKMVEDVWKTGVRVKVKEDGLLEGGELKRCLEEVMGGERGKKMMKNAARWRELAREADAKGGSSDRNVRAFVERWS